MYQEMLQGGGGSGFRYDFGNMNTVSSYLSQINFSFSNLNSKKATVELNYNTNEANNRTWRLYINDSLVKTLDTYSNRKYVIENITPETVIKMEKGENSANAVPGHIIFE